jgi:hypothetical protein
MVMLAFPLLLGAPVGYLLLQLRLLARWQGGFRAAAALPMLGWVVWGGLFVRDIARDPTSHNLFPFEILIGVAIALPFFGLLAGARRLWHGPPSAR